jgi:hypothetical protein
VIKLSNPGIIIENRRITTLKRKKRPPELKRKVAIVALRECETIHAISARYEVHSVQVCQREEGSLNLPIQSFASGTAL